MVFYIERKRRRPDGEKSSSECQVFECETWTKTPNKGSRKASRNTVRLIPKPPEFNLSQPPNPFDILNDEKNHPIDARDKFLLYYLNHNELTTKTTNHDVDAIRDKCNSFKIQLLAGTSDYAKLLPSQPNSHLNNNNNANTQLSGAAGYNYIRSKIVPNSDSNSNSSSSSYWFGSSNNRTNNVLLKTNQSPTPKIDDSISKNVNSANSYNSFSSSNLFSSFLYSFSILFVLFIFVFFIYLYYSR